MLRRILLALLLVVPIAAPAASLPGPSPGRLAVLQRGIAFTNWFRFPYRRDPAFLRSYLSDSALREIAGWGITFVRLAVQPELLVSAEGRLDPERVALLTGVVRRLHAVGLAVVIDIQPNGWPLDRAPAARARLVQFWTEFAPILRALDPDRTFPELLNEPVFPDPTTWAALQAQLLAIVRAALPRSTVILTGADWGSIDGLRRLAPVADRNVIYSFHFYEPAVLTTLGAFEPGLDRVALGRLPFPLNPHGCAEAEAAAAQRRTQEVIRFYCAGGWSAASLGARIAEAHEWARVNHAAVLMGEFGASSGLNPAARLAWLSAVRHAVEANGIGWALWGYDDPMGLGRVAGRIEPDPAVLRALGLNVVSARR